MTMVAIVSVGPTRKWRGSWCWLGRVDQTYPLGRVGDHPVPGPVDAEGEGEVVGGLFEHRVSVDRFAGQAILPHQVAVHVKGGAA